MSRDGPDRPDPKPITAISASAAAPGTAPSPTTIAESPAIVSAAAMFASSLWWRSTSQPPAIMPAALPSM